MANRKDLFDQLDEIRKELSSLQNRVTNIYAIANELGIQDQPRPTCPDCMITFRWATQLDEHLYLTHDGDVPAHWLDAEARSIDFTAQPPTLEGR